jgi:hypothetical protein
MTAELDRKETADDWAARGFNCDMWTNPPGQRETLNARFGIQDGCGGRELRCSNAMNQRLFTRATIVPGPHTSPVIVSSAAVSPSTPAIS